MFTLLSNQWFAKTGYAMTKFGNFLANMQNEMSIGNWPVDNNYVKLLRWSMRYTYMMYMCMHNDY